MTVFESVKALEIETSMVFNLVLSCFFFFLIIDLYFLIVPVIAQIIIVAAELGILTGILTKEAQAEIEKHPVTVEAIISECSL